MKLWLNLAALAITTIFVLTLQPLFGSLIANTLMWAVAGWQFANWTVLPVDWIYKKLKRDSQ